MSRREGFHHILAYWETWLSSAWPLGIPEKEEKYEEYLKKRIMDCMYYDDVVKNKHGKMEPLHPFYNLDGYNVKL
ncbi:MAG: hypothetical protein FGF50_09965, partial [Candidatus Brockarchaeota archaeon]|nr:hypothetical protein [Candidatus Brockarchaeota archaeon]